MQPPLAGLGVVPELRHGRHCTRRAATLPPYVPRGRGLADREPDHSVAVDLDRTIWKNLTNWDPEVSGEFIRLMEGISGGTVRNYHDKEFVVHSKAIRTRFAEQYGLDYVKAAGKNVPACVRTAGHKAQRAFLSALFEGDGWIDPTSTIGIVQNWPAMIRP